MFWIFILVFFLALMLVKLGAMSVWVSILSLAFKLALLVIAGLAAVVLWRKVFPRKGVTEATPRNR